MGNSTSVMTQDEIKKIDLIYEEVIILYNWRLKRGDRALTDIDFINKGKILLNSYTDFINDIKNRKIRNKKISFIYGIFIYIEYLKGILCHSMNSQIH